MSHRILLPALVLFCAAASAGAAVTPAASPVAPPAREIAVPAAAAANPAWLQPAANSSVEKPDTTAKLPGTGAPLGALFKSACSSACLQDEFACFNGCGGDHDCNVSCSNDYYCCLQACDPFGPQCF